MSLNARAWLSLAILAVAVGLLLFLTAGTIRYWQGWLYLAVLFSFAALVTASVMRQDPALLERRMRGGPTANSCPGYVGYQKTVRYRLLPHVS